MDSSYQSEVSRIRNEYKRRAAAFAETYRSPGDMFIYKQRSEAVTKTLRQEHFSSLADKQIFEVGCGIGAWLMDLKNWGASEENLHGIDLDGERLGEAVRRLPKADLKTGEASHLPWKDNAFDLVLQSTLFTSILNENLKQKIASEMLRVLKPGGFILWYDFFYDNPFNPNVRGIKAGEIRRLFPGCKISFQKITLAPPFARALAPLSAGFCRFLEKINLFNTHYLAVIRPENG